MPAFRWLEPSQDIALAKEVVAHRPQKPLDRDVIASNLSVAFSTEDNHVDLKGRGCRERLHGLLEKYKAEDTRSLKQYVCTFVVRVCVHVRVGVLRNGALYRDVLASLFALFITK